MDRKDIYEHLAKIYLDASSKTKKKKKAKVHHKLIEHIQRPFAVGILVFLALAAATAVLFPRYQRYSSQLALVFRDEAIKINFNFDPAKKEIYSVKFNDLNFSKYKWVAFSLRKVNREDTVSLRVELTNSFREKAEIYLKDIPLSWTDYKIPLSEFKTITDWSEVDSLAFIVEEWNTVKKKGIVYIDNVRILK